MARPSPPPLSESHERRLAAFARWADALLSADEASRESAFALCRRAAAGGHPADVRSTLDQLDEILMGEIARLHR